MGGWLAEPKPTDHKLRQWRLSHGFTLLAFGREAGVNWKVVNKIEVEGTGCHIDTACAIIAAVRRHGGGLDFEDLRYNPR